MKKGKSRITHTLHEINMKKSTHRDKIPAQMNPSKEKIMNLRRI